MFLQGTLTRKIRAWKTFELSKQQCSCTFHNFSGKTLTHGLKTMNIKYSMKKPWHPEIDQCVQSSALFPYQEIIFFYWIVWIFIGFFMTHHLISESGDEKRDICLCHVNGKFSAVTTYSYTFCKQNIPWSHQVFSFALQQLSWGILEQFKQPVSQSLVYFNHTGQSI